PVEVRFAIADTDAQSARWLSLRVRSPERRVAFVLPVLASMAVDPVSDAWFDALEQTSAVRVLAPAVTEDGKCGSGAAVENTAAPDANGVPPSQVAVLTSLAALRQFASQQGLELSAVDESALAALVSEQFLVLLYTPAQAEFWTETLRIVSVPGKSPSELAPLLADSSVAVAATLFSLGAGRARFDASAEVTAPELGATWLLASSSSDYLRRRSAALESSSAFVLESSDIEAIYETRYVWPSLSGESLRPLQEVPSLVQSYFERARRLELAPGSTAACEASVAASREQNVGGLRVARACAPGVLAAGSERANCVEGQAPEQISPAALRCGAADDLAFAFSGQIPSSVRLTRHVARIEPGDDRSFTPRFAAGADVASIWSAARFEGTCQTPSGWGSGSGGSTGTPVGGAGTHAGYGGQAGYAGYDGYDEESDAYAAVHEGGCASSVNLDCGSDEPGYAAEEDESCDSDSSESSESESCSGDDSSGYDGETCSDDSSGSDDSGYDGETCSDDSSSDEEDTCSVRRARVRPRLSVVTLALVSVLLPLRRWRRRKQRNFRARHM
ncbi:MAG TPA: hypothetical protein VK524_12285, partial [Polyangiaceae bacterium]|nr:hypothetical protein [Polyangiaceae bacterium]